MLNISFNNALHKLRRAHHHTGINITTTRCHGFCNKEMEVVFDELIKRGIESSFTMPIMSYPSEP